MDPLGLVVAAGAYVAAELAKKSADAVISAAYNRLQSYVMVKLGRKVLPADLDAETFQKSGLSDDPEISKFRSTVISRSSALRRVRLVEAAIKGARILWVDDQPANNRSESQMLQSLGAEVWQVCSTQEAIRQLSQNRFDLLLSDMDRDGLPDAGLRMLAQLGRDAPPVVFYVGWVDQSRGVPQGAFGIADRPEPLLHLVLDVLERSRI